MPFRFRLQPLLEMRRRAEDAAKLALAELERERRSLEEEVRRRQREIESGKAGLREALTGRLDTDALRRDAASTIAVDRLARTTVLQLVGLLRRIESARERLVEASQRRRAVEILKEHRRAEWLRAEAKRETEMLDEIGAREASRPAREEYAA